MKPPAGVAIAIVLLAALPPVRGLRAQENEDSLPGVRLGLVYEEAYRPALAIKPFDGRFGGGAAASRVDAIIARDLRYSDRFEMLDSIPASFVAGQTIDYALWDQLNAVWLVTGQVEGSGEGLVLVLELHDVVYGKVKARERFALPDPSSESFRMAVHTASDAVVEWIFEEPGMAASRILFVREMDDGTKEIYRVDADGENLRRVTRFKSITMSPTWSPDGLKMAYTSFKDGKPGLYEMDLSTGVERRIDFGAEGQPMSPAYHPGGRFLTFGLMGRRTDLVTYDVERDCCLRELIGGRSDDLSPTYSPDGRRMAFNSNRLGVAAPQIYVASANGEEPELISPYVFGEPTQYSAPDWSPVGNRIAFHGMVRRGRYHILVAEVDDGGRRVVQLTREGNNEDPSWAPDGRHLVFVGERSHGFGVFVVDTATGRIRTLVEGIRANTPEWSPTLGVEAEEEALRTGSY